MEPNTLYIGAGIVAVLLAVLFIISKIVGCGFKILKFIILLTIIGLVVYGASTLFIK